MYNPDFTDPQANLLTNRLARVIDTIRNLTAATKEEYQAEIYTQINKIVANGYNAAKVPYIAGQTPAKIDDFDDAITVLDEDASDIISEVLDVENSAATYYNLSAAANNELRQNIRSGINASTQNRFIETFINQSQISSTDGTVDFSSGSYSPNVTSTVVLSPVISIGSKAVGSGDLTTLNSTDQTVYFSWIGSVLELIFTFSKPTAINRLVLNQYDYKDLSITSLTSTPDGSVVQDLLEELNVSYISCGVTANKSLGDTTVDFNPKSCLALRILIKDNSGSGVINLNSITLNQQIFSSSSTLISNLIGAPTGTVRFKASSITQEPYSVISHYISYDGTSYSVITPDQVIIMPTGTTGYYFKCIVSRNESLISQSGTFTGNGLDPSSSAFYSLQTVTTNILGNNIIEKNLLFNNISGAVIITDAVIPNTFYIQLGSTIVPKSSYQFLNGTLTFTGTVNNVTVVYQTNADVSSVASLLQYFGSRLVQYSFERA